MKILMTGFTPRGVASTKTLYTYMSNAEVIRRGLSDGGHEVDHRAVDVGEPDLTSRYDVALVGLAVPQSLSSRYVYGALWAATEFGEARTRYYVDDWLLHQFKSQLESGLRNPEKRMFSLDNRTGFELAKTMVPRWVAAFKHLAYGRYKLLLPTFPWARPRVLLPKLDNVTPVIFDPTPAAMENSWAMYGENGGPITFDPVPPQDRERAWVLAAMRDIAPWYNKQRFSWPVHKYGNKRLNEPVVTERELIDVYRKTWGIIGAPYGAVAAGGGWRVRYIHAAVTRSILFLDPDEASTAGRPYYLYRSIVEKASTDELSAIAEKQRQHLFSSCWTMDKLIQTLNDYVSIEVPA